MHIDEQLALNGSLFGMVKSTCLQQSQPDAGSVASFGGAPLGSGSSSNAAGRTDPNQNFIELYLWRHKKLRS